jgi:hypothetical protein
MKGGDDGKVFASDDRESERFGRGTGSDVTEKESTTGPLYFWTDPDLERRSP